MRLYVVSDIHGYYDYLIKSLNEAGYDENDTNSLLIDCGDFFDRGDQAVEIFKYYKRLTDSGKAIVLKGNHTQMLIDFLNGKDCQFNFTHNGLNKTLDSFLEDTSSWHTFMFYVTDCEDKELVRSIYGDRVIPVLGKYNSSIPMEIYFDIYQEYAREKINKDFPELLPWLESLPYYFETENYIFTHAAIDGNCKDWKNPTYTKYDDWTPWQWLTWDDGGFFKEEIKNTDKTVVVGHFYTDAIREKFGIKVTGTNEILRADDGRKIYIDTCTPITRRVNVLTITDNIIIGGYL